MASFRKRGKVWECFVARHGIRKSGTFDTKAEAQAWAIQTEADILNGKRGGIPDKSFGQLLERYRDEVSVNKRGERWERMRVGLILRDDKLAEVKLVDLSAVNVAEWRERRLAVVSAASVRREWNLLSHACTIAAKEWHWLPENPFAEVKRPPPATARDRRITDNEIERLLLATGYDYQDPPVTATARVGAALLFAIETAMRAGEIAGLTWDNVFVAESYLKTSGKTAAARRNVPLSAEALRILKQLEGIRVDGVPLVFQLTTPALDALFRKCKTRAMIKDLHFHDSRHEAITRLAKKLDVLALARAVGHRDLRMLQIYYNESATDLAKRLD